MNPLELESGRGAAPKPSDAVTPSKPIGNAIIGSLFLKIASLAIVAACTGVYFLVGSKLRTGVQDSYEMCGMTSKTFDNFESPPVQYLRMWVYNITNPYEFLNLGASANVTETGMYSYGFQLHRGNISFADNIVTYNQFPDLTFSPSTSCPSCSSDSDEMYVFNSAYAALLAQVHNEAKLILAATCTQVQIGLIGPGTPCAKNERGNSSFACPCCGPTSPCSSLFKSAPAAGKFSYLHMLDSGIESSVGPYSSNYPLISNYYTGVVRKLSVSEILTGSASAFSGALSYNSASASDKDYMSVVTNDMREVCEPLFCPNRTEILDLLKIANATVTGNYLKHVRCKGRVPAYGDLISRLAEKNVTISEARAQELRYLQGVNCLPYTATFITAIYMKKFRLAGSCHDPSLSPPCCMAQVGMTPPVISPVSGYGSGCLRFVDGYMLKRRVYDIEEAQTYLNSKFSMYTNCAPESKRMVEIMDRDITKYVRWITPSSGPDMVWADPTVLAKQLAAPQNGSSVTIQLDGDAGYMFAAKALKFKKSFWLEPTTLVDYSDVEETHTVISTTTASLRDLKYEGKVSVRDLESLRYTTDFSNTTSDETSIRSGELPYRNMFNQYFQAGGRPVILSLPNFYGISERIWDQTDNSKRNATAGNGINVYRLSEGYSSGSSLLSEPELMSAANMKQFEEYFKETFDYATVTGNAVSFRVPSMVSGYTLNCNPSLDKTCNLAMVPGATNLCYSQRSNPCSAANVFTPHLQGEKVVPILWLRLEGDANEPRMSAIKNITVTLYGLSVVTVVFTIIFGLLLIGWLTARAVAKPRVHQYDDDKVVA